ncbi:uncharacterized protein [Panulirus ornatus]|uniref:uncharacterized protein n=1 Tax=Panulirus ornatus TaxID=150431 RepID=UPI003A83E4C7
MMNRLMMRKAKSCPSCKDFETPPCYDCTFNMNHPPPDYASLSEHSRCHSYAQPHSPIRLEHSLPALPQMHLDPSEHMDDTDFEVSRLTQAVCRIGLAVSFLSSESQPGGAFTDSRTQNLSAPISVPPSTTHTNFPRNSSAPELQPEASVGSPRDHQVSEDHLLLNAITSHVSGHHLDSSAHSSHLSSREPSPLPCQLLVPE